MSTSLPRTVSAILGIAILAAVLAAGCTSPSGQTPATTQVTTVVTTVQATPAATTRASATTVPPTTAATTPPVVTTMVAPTTPVTPSPVAVTIQNFLFNPASVTVPAGTTVTWTNQDTAVHQIASDTLAFSSIALGQGGKYSFTFTTPGTYPYHCTIHSFMKGTVIVR